MIRGGKNVYNGHWEGNDNKNKAAKQGHKVIRLLAERNTINLWSECTVLKGCLLRSCNNMRGYGRPTPTALGGLCLKSPAGQQLKKHTVKVINCQQTEFCLI